MISSAWCPRLDDLLSAEACNLVREVHSFDGVDQATAAALLLALPNGMAFVYTGSIDGNAVLKAINEASRGSDLRYVLLLALRLHDIFKVICNQLGEPAAGEQFDQFAVVRDKRARYVGAAITMTQEAYPPWDMWRPPVPRGFHPPRAMRRLALAPVGHRFRRRAQMFRHLPSLLHQ